MFLRPLQYIVLHRFVSLSPCALEDVTDPIVGEEIQSGSARNYIIIIHIIKYFEPVASVLQTN